MKKERWIKLIVAVGVVVIAIGGYVLYNNKPMKLLTQQVVRGSVTGQVELNATIESEYTDSYYARVSAAIESIRIKKGDSIKTGDQIISYDVSDLERSFEQAKLGIKSSEAGYQASVNNNSKNSANYKNAATSLEILEQQIADEKASISNISESLANAQEIAAEITARSTSISSIIEEKELKKAKKEIDSLQEEYDNYNVPSLTGDLSYHQTELTQLLTSQSEYKAQQKTADASLIDNATKEQLSTAKESSQITKEQAEEELEKAKQGITANRDGIVTSLDIEEGAVVMKGTRLFVVESLTDLKAIVKVSKYDIGKIELGQSAKVMVAGNEYKAIVSKINKMAENLGSDKPEIAVELHIENPDDKIYIGLEADATIITAQRQDILTIPSIAVYTDDNGVYCYAIESDLITKKYFTKGVEGQGQIEVLDGLEEGTFVITDAITDQNVGEKAVGIRG